MCDHFTDNGNGIRFVCVKKHNDAMHVMKREPNLPTLEELTRAGECNETELPRVFMFDGWHAVQLMAFSSLLSAMCLLLMFAWFK